MPDIASAGNNNTDEENDTSGTTNRASGTSAGNDNIDKENSATSVNSTIGAGSVTADTADARAADEMDVSNNQDASGLDSSNAGIKVRYF